MGFFNLTQEVAIDLGTANTVIIHGGKIVVNAPSIVALEGEKMIAVGHKAQQMEGKTPANIRTVRPLRDGVIAVPYVTLANMQEAVMSICFTSQWQLP